MFRYIRREHTAVQEQMLEQSFTFLKKSVMRSGMPTQQRQVSPRRPAHNYIMWLIYRKRRNSQVSHTLADLGSLGISDLLVIHKLLNYFLNPKSNIFFKLCKGRGADKHLFVFMPLYWNSLSALVKMSLRPDSARCIKYQRTSAQILL